MSLADLSDNDWWASQRFSEADEESLASSEEGLLTRGALKRSTDTLDDYQPRAIVRRETRWVIFFKILLITVFSTAAICVSVATYYHVKREETHGFETQFNDFATHMIQTFYHSTNVKMWTANLVGVTITSYAKHSGEVFPNVTLDGWKPAIAGALRLADSSIITYAPILNTEEELSQWEAYAVEQDRSSEGFGPPPGGTGGGAGSGEGEWTGGGAGSGEGRRAEGEEGSGGAGSVGANRSGSRRLYYDNVFQRDVDVSEERTIADGIYSFEGDKMVDFEGPGPYAPIWHMSPGCNRSACIMYNQMSERGRREAIEKGIQHREPTFSRILYNEDHDPPHFRQTPRSILFYPVMEEYFMHDRVAGVVGVEFEWEEYFDMTPSQFDGIVIVLATEEDQLFTFKVQGGMVKFWGEGDLHDAHFDAMKLQSTFSGFHDLCHHGADFWMTTFGRRLKEKDDSSTFSEIKEAEDTTVTNHNIHYEIRLYPSEAFQAKHITNTPKYYAVAVAMIFLFTSTLIVLYDCFVQRRQNLTMETAERSNAVFNALFPAVVRDRLLQTRDKRNQRSKSKIKKERSVFRKKSAEAPKTWKKLLPEPPKLKLRSFLRIEHTHDTVENDEEDLSLSPPIADLFPNTTVMFADIAGFTAWSSEREPAQVFVLLETVYRNFDKLAKRLGVFKVETIGDCYVAATGLPEPQRDHAVVLARFAWECVLTMGSTCKGLEATLGPGTAELALRVGLHSGPTTAGVLRGEKSRFQLFGDTMNTASRMESNGIKNMVQVSQSTADLLMARGKQHWLTQREDKIEAKGKGTMQTYWLRPPRQSSPVTGISDSYRGRHGSLDTTLSSVSGTSVSYRVRHGSLDTTLSSVTGSSDGCRRGSTDTTLSVNSDSLTSLLAGARSFYGRAQSRRKSTSNQANLIDWNVEVLLSSLRKVVAIRQNADTSRKTRRRVSGYSSLRLGEAYDGAPIEELTGIIELPVFNDKVVDHRTGTDLLDGDVRTQLRRYVLEIASMYQDNPFHNLEHASHVTMSANKLMNRIVVPEDVDYEQGDAKRKQDLIALAERVHNSTFGISSDPLAQFAIIFSALIHDVDHTGLPNSQLVKEGVSTAIRFQGLSVAEQNSVSVAWSLLMEPEYEKLRMTIFPTASECKRFRQLVVNVVLATDIIDSKLQQLRKNRWDKAFHATSVLSDDVEKDMNRKATIVMEHIIQASDVAHTMQHWHTYCKWNEKLFQERYRAFLTGHEEEDPSESWYEDEIRFFDNYVIPLANKLKECGVFGVSSDEYLGFAIENRAEWEMKGREVVQAMLHRVQQDDTRRLLIPQNSTVRFQLDLQQP